MKTFCKHVVWERQHMLSSIFYLLTYESDLPLRIVCSRVHVRSNSSTRCLRLCSVLSFFAISCLSVSTLWSCWWIFDVSMETTVPWFSSETDNEYVIDASFILLLTLWICSVVFKLLAFTHTSYASVTNALYLLDNLRSLNHAHNYFTFLL